MYAHTFEGVVFVSVNDGAIDRINGTQVIVAVPNEWLQLPIIDLLSAQREEFTRVKSLVELYQKVREHARSIVIIDIFAYTEDHRDIVGRLTRENPCLSLISLVSGSKVEFVQHLDSSDSCYIVPKEKMDTQLLAALACAHKDQGLTASAQDSLSIQKQPPALRKREANQMEKESGSIFGRKFGRRSFLKGSAAAAVAVGVATGLPEYGMVNALAAETSGAPGQAAEETYYGCCRGNCNGGCRLKITVRNGKVVKTTMAEMPADSHNRICAKGISHLQRIYSPRRIKHPMKRVGERGSGQWQQITWDEAIQEICTSWKNIQSKYGKNSVAFSFGSGNMSIYAYNFPGKLQNLMGASQVNLSYDNTVILNQPLMTGVSYAYTANDPADLVNSKCIILWAANPALAQIQNWHFIAKAKKNGAKLIVIDPNYTVSASKADIHLAIRPGTDAALTMGMINMVVEQGWEDLNFLKKSTVAPFLVKSSDGKFLRASDLGVLAPDAKDEAIVMGENGATGVVSAVSDPVLHGTFNINGIEVTTAYDLLLKKCAEWTPEKVAEICNLPVDDIKEVVRLYATSGPATIYTGLGVDHYTNGHYSYYGFTSLAAVTGNMGKKGAFCGWPLCIPQLIIMNTADLAPEGSQPGPTIPGPVYPKVVKEKDYYGTPVDLKSLYIYGHNPVANQTQRKAWVEAFNEMELIVVADIQETDTTRYADIVLPVTHWFETMDVMGINSPFMLYQEQAIAPLFEAKDDFEITNLLGRGMGFGEYFTRTKEQQYELALDHDHAKAIHCTFKDLKDKKAVLVSPAPDYVFGEDGVFGTRSGRVEFYLESPAPFQGIVWEKDFNIDNERMVHFQPPYEAWPEDIGKYQKNALADKYPLVFTTERNRLKTHTQFGHNPWLLEIDPEPVVRLNPKDAAERSIAEGDYVRIFNDRGHVVVKAVISVGVHQGVILMPKGWELDQFKEGHYSDLTSHDFNPAVPNNCYFDCLVEVKKV